MAATAITINSNVASIGDMAFLDFNMFLVDMSSPFYCLENPTITYLTCMNSKSTFKITVSLLGWCCWFVVCVCVQQR
jgi:hypothetical protein